MPDASRNLMSIFAEALERTDAAARAAYLDSACAGDAALLRRVQALLAAHDRPETILEPGSAEISENLPTETEESTQPAAPKSCPATEPATGAERPSPTISTIAGAPPFDRAGAFVPGLVIGGRYTLREVLGEGGMGTVYRADQIEPVKRQVALNLIKTGMDSRAVLARFDAERQALALMDHPNIARVYDGGTTSSGQPFFAMELVSGVPITKYCDRQQLPVRARLELFVAACQAVQHAHQKGIIHRDLKPNNVMVTEVDGRPTPKVIDFGVAKAIEFSLTDLSLADTGAIVGTPMYMSPEQADPSSMDIDTRTDVYALGVILYELLAGSPPIEATQFQRGAILEMLRMVREVDPPKPSTKVSTTEALPSIAASRGIDPEQLKRVLKGDLDWIVMKALDKDRTRRYATANGFAADILRHLANEPVLAAPPSRAYRLRKFVRKHRSAVIAVSLIALALVCGIAGTTLGMFRAEARRVEADRARAAEAERVKERDAALAKAEDARQIADARSLELKYRLGVSDMVLATAAYDNRDVVVAAERLDNVPEEQRGWEWRYLKRLTRGGLFTLYGHMGRVQSVAFSPDGTRVLTGSQDKTAKVWDARTGMPVLELKGHTGAVLAVSFSPDGTRIATGSHDRSAKVWDARTGTVLLELTGHADAVLAVSFSPDPGAPGRIATASDDQSARVWDARTGTALLELKGHTAGVMSVSYSPDGTRLATASADRTASVWDARTGTSLVSLNGHTAAVTGASFSPDGTRIVTGSRDQTAKVWDAQTGAKILDLKGHKDWVTSVAFSPDGTRVVSGSDDKTAMVWDAQTGTILRELKGHTSSVWSAAFSPDGTQIVTGSQDHTAKLWDARTASPLVEMTGHIGWVLSVSFSPDGTRIFTGSQDGTARVWDAKTATLLLELTGHSSSVSSASFSPDGTRIVTGSYDGTVKVWDARTGATLVNLTGHAGWVLTVAFSPDGTRIVSGSSDETAKVWDAATGTPLLELKGHTVRVNSASFSPDGTRIVSGGLDKTARVWDARTGRPLLELNGHTDGVSSAAFSPDGNQIGTGSIDRTAKIWDARTGKLVRDLKAHTNTVTSLSFSPDGTRVVTGSWDQSAKVWDARTGTPLLDLKGHTKRIDGVSFGPDGTRIATCSFDKTAKVWSAPSGTPLIELKGHTDRVLCVSFSPDASRIASGSEDQTAKVWDARTGVSLLDLKGHTERVLSVSFSLDGARIVTASWDRTAKVWDARTGVRMLDLKGHLGSVWSASFNADGTWIVTGSSDKTARLWDAQTGALLHELKGHTREVTNATFSSDGTRIVTSADDESSKVWDARTGQELRGEPIPGAPRPGPISPDKRLIAHPAGNRVELVPLQPDADELANRLLHTQPKSGRLREAYEAARAANDPFAVRFYHDRLPPSELIRLRAEAIVMPLFARLLLREDVLAALNARPSADPEVQAACLKLAGSWPEAAMDCNNVGFSLVREPGQPAVNYQRGLRLALAACRLEPFNGFFLNTLGVAQYRSGLITEALVTLTRSNGMNKQKEPADLAFLALAQYRLGQLGQARDTLTRLRALMKRPQPAGYQEAEAFLREAETIERDHVFPDNPFAPSVRANAPNP